MGGEWWGASDDAEAVRTIHRSLDLGMNLIDTAENYGNGHSEEVIGQALRGRRQQAIISDKVYADHLRPDQIRQAFEGSCRRLQTDYIDIYFIHWPNPDVSLADAVGEMEKLRGEGKIRVIGVSNFTAAEMAEAQRSGRVDVLQPPYSLFWRFIEKEDVPYCLRNDVGIMAYSCLAQGLLTGTLRRDTQFPVGDQRRTTVLFQPENYGRCLDAVEKMRPIAEKYGKTLAQLALNWVVHQPGISCALNGAQTVREAEENAGAVGWYLSPDDEARLNSYSREVTDTFPEYPDMFQNWAHWDIQKRRYEQSGRTPRGEEAA
jgi:aryl-alcohol dehydrogenase-like predicted oxidoreductase